MERKYRVPYVQGMLREVCDAVEQGTYYKCMDYPEDRLRVVRVDLETREPVFGGEEDSAEEDTSDVETTLHTAYGERALEFKVVRTSCRYGYAVQYLRYAPHEGFLYLHDETFDDDVSRMNAYFWDHWRARMVAVNAKVPYPSGDCTHREEKVVREVPEALLTREEKTKVRVTGEDTGRTD